MKCHVTSDLNRHLDSLGRSDSYDSAVERVKFMYTAEDASAIIDNYIGETGGYDLIYILGQMAVSTQSPQKLEALLDKILDAAAQEEVNTIFEAGDE